MVFLKLNLFSEERFILQDREVEKQFYQLVKQSLGPFVHGFSHKDIDAVENTNKRLGRYVVLNNQLYVRGMESRVISSILLALIDTPEGLPDLDFLFFHNDGATHEFGHKKVPVFCTDKAAHLISAVPLHDRGCPLNNAPEKWFKKFWFRDWYQIFKTVNESQIDWDNRKDQLVWRGSKFTNGYPNLPNSPRGKICLLSKRYPDLIDAQFASAINCFSKNHSAELTTKEQLQYKFQILLHGGGGCFPGAYWRLLSGSLVFYVDDEKLLPWFFPLLKKNSDYIPISYESIENIPQLIQHFLTSGREQAKQIAHNSRVFALNYLTHERMNLFVKMMLNEYAKLYTDHPAIDSTFRSRSGFNEDDLKEHWYK